MTLLFQSHSCKNWNYDSSFLLTRKSPLGYINQLFDLEIQTDSWSIEQRNVWVFIKILYHLISTYKNIYRLENLYYQYNHFNNKKQVGQCNYIITKNCFWSSYKYPRQYFWKKNFTLSFCFSRFFNTQINWMFWLQTSADYLIHWLVYMFQLEGGGDFAEIWKWILHSCKWNVSANNRQVIHF